MIKQRINILLGLGLVFFTGCYSFTGVNLHPDVKTLNVIMFTNNAPLFNPTLVNEFTNGLQDFMVQRYSFDLTNENAHIELSGQISQYAVTPTALSVGDVASQNRLTIGVKVKYTNKLEPDKNFDKEFTDYEDFSSGQSLASVESTLVSAINQRLFNQIFNAVAADW